MRAILSLLHRMLNQYAARVCSRRPHLPRNAHAWAPAQHSFNKVAATTPAPAHRAKLTRPFTAKLTWRARQMRPA
ncbi:unnamed protein product [Mycetohabitans rhizoxinica HKI 454]|uniref:Uncharacterized protein n=1 Tax=Mycetohabitans rhizoxinica (strain DSM 19002 / CIP 109453 / HKI 454) TaxID=882378 RepID=E5AS31_MYCRK|nr:unnamed protein product [Mycetohabitans rhizoxinica HKI 454]